MFVLVDLWQTMNDIRVNAVYYATVDTRTHTQKERHTGPIDAIGK